MTASRNGKGFTMGRRVIKINHQLTKRLKEALALLPPVAAQIFRTTKVYVCDIGRGWGGINDGVPTAVIPSWAFKESVNFCGKGVVKGGIEFVAYYLAHELAHVAARVRGHNAAFYLAFKELCPPSLQHYELRYKPRAAASCGIGQ